MCGTRVGVQRRAARRPRQACVSVCPTSIDKRQSGRAGGRWRHTEASAVLMGARASFVFHHHLLAEPSQARRVL
eukprot:4801157-Lingulodinium_polyedra.AAC.1